MKVYGVGAGKSGTTTLAEMFRPAYRSRHEAELAAIVPLAAAVTEGGYDPAQIRAALLDRHERLRLEVDVAGFLNPLVGELVAAFPDALFILTIRNCFEWLASRVDQRARVLRDGPEPPAHLRVADLRSYDEPYEADDAWLEEMGLPSIRGLLHRWADANTRVLEVVPSERLLVVRTEDLSSSLPAIAAFTGCPPATLTVTRSNVRTFRTGFVEAVDRRRLVERAEEHCGAIMERYWGRDWRDLALR